MYICICVYIHGNYTYVHVYAHTYMYICMHIVSLEELTRYFNVWPAIERHHCIQPSTGTREQSQPQPLSLPLLPRLSPLPTCPMEQQVFEVCWPSPQPLLSVELGHSLTHIHRVHWHLHLRVYIRRYRIEPYKATNVSATELPPLLTCSKEKTCATIAKINIFHCMISKCYRRRCS